MADHGIKVSKLGHDVSEGDNHLIFNSKYPLLKIFDSGSGTVTCTNGILAPTSLKEHNLGYKPYYFVWIEYVDITTATKVEQLKTCSWREYAGVSTWAIYHAAITNTHLYLQVNTALGVTVDLKYNYVIFYDPLA